MLPALPGWNSLPTVTRYHNWAEITGIVILGILEIAEVIAYKYGHRRDYLTEQQQVATDHRHEDEMGRLHVEAARLSVEAENAKAAIAGANARALEAQVQLEKLRAPRILTTQQLQTIADKIRGFGVRFETVTYGADPEADSFAKQIAHALTLGDWESRWMDESLLSSVSGVLITKGKAAEERDNAAANALARALRDEGIFATALLDAEDATTTADVALRIVVGRKP